MNKELNEKTIKLREIIEKYGSLAVAFSGGVDSTFLLAFANEVIPGNVIAVNIDARLAPEKEKRNVEKFCESRGIDLVTIDTDALDIEGFAENPPERCYICKKALFSKVIREAAARGITTVAEGSNVDDDGDYRPGMKAVKELGVTSPLKEVGLYKSEIRELSKEMGLSTWNKPSAACLASRIPYGEIITHEKIKMIDTAEEYLAIYGYHQCRVRMHGNIARIELMPEDIPGFVNEDVRTNVYEKFREIGFDYVTLDIKGYRTGSLNETLIKPEEAKP